MSRATASYPRRTVLLREQSHRRAVLLSIAAMLLLSTGPVFGHHVAHGVDAMLAGKDHLGALCLIALHSLLAPVHVLFHAVIVAGLFYASWDRFRAWRTVRRVLASVEAERPTEGDVFWAAAAAAGVDPHCVRVVDGLPSPAFTVGWWKPKIFVSRALAMRLTVDEMVALFAHEGAHADRRDPLRLSLARFIARTLFWLPTLARLADDLADEAEVVADDAAARRGPLTLASALVEIASTFRPTRLSDAAIGFCRHDLLERRVRRLAGQDVSIRSHVTRRSIVTATVALGLVLVSGVAVAHPMPTFGEPGVTAHCEHRHAWAISHLFCLGFTAPTRAPCPHTGR